MRIIFAFPDGTRLKHSGSYTPAIGQKFLFHSIDARNYDFKNMTYPPMPDSKQYTGVEWKVSDVMIVLGVATKDGWEDREYILVALNQ